MRLLNLYGEFFMIKKWIERFIVQAVIKDIKNNGTIIQAIISRSALSHPLRRSGQRQEEAK